MKLRPLEGSPRSPAPSPVVDIDVLLVVLRPRDRSGCLAAGTKERRSLCLADTPDWRMAIRTGFPLATVYLKESLETAAFIVHISEIADARSVMANGEKEERSDFFEERGSLFGCQAAGGNPRIETRPKERLAGVNVADSTEDLLVQEENLNGDGAAPAPR